MPIYEYRCDTCEKPTEIIQKSTDPAPASCSYCGSGPMVKQLSMSSFALRGTGWYVTDFKDGSGAKPATPTTSDQ